MERYESLGVVGEGSYGVVLKCRHRETGRIVAIKKFLESDDDPNVKKIALREVRMLKKVRHENLVNLIEFFRRKRRLYLVFEYVDHTVLDELEAADGGLDPDVARSHIFQVIRGVAFCHKNQIVHRDVKPENVLVSRLGVVKLCDFGFARILEGPNESCTDYVATRWYRAPELLVGDTKYGRKVDIWAIGCLLSEILSGDPLFPGESDIDQLFHIIQTLGELTSSHQVLVTKNPMLSGLRMPTAASIPLASTFPGWCPRTLLFVSECLDLTPEKRPSAEELLQHVYFTHDAFPETFLPELRKYVQQEFSDNPLTQPPSARKGSGLEEKRSKTEKKERSDNYATKIVSKTLQQLSRMSPQKNSTIPSTDASTSFQEDFLNPPLIPSHIQSHLGSHSHNYNQAYVHSFTQPSNSCASNSFSQARNEPHSPPSQAPAPHQPSSSGYGQSQNETENTLTQPSSTLSNKSFITYTTLTSTNFGTRSNPFRFDDGPVSLPFSHIPPLKDTTSGNNNGAGTQFGNANVSSIFGSSFFPSKAHGGINLQLMTSPTRKLRKEEKTRKSPQNFWSFSTNSKNQNFLIKNQNQHAQTSSTEPSILSSGAHRDSSNFLQMDNNNAASINSPFSRHHQFDFSRHPYAISLDRTKESSGRESSRDPLREIKENAKETKRGEALPSRDAKEGVRKPRREVASFAKPKLLNDDLYLPTLLGAAGKSNSPKKVSKPNVGSGDRVPKESGHRAKKPEFTMPFLTGLNRGSASSVDSADGFKSGSNLPLV